jgi:hypothetical protein
MAATQGQAFDDLRNSISECLRIVRNRWRLALVGMCVISSIAFWYSQFLPREYSASTLFERRDDVVLQNLITSNSPYGFGHLKNTLTLDMIGSRALARAAALAGLVPAEMFTGDGALSESERAALDEAMQAYQLRPSVTLPQCTPSLDTILVKCTSNDPAVARRFVVALRDSYISQTRAKMREILDSAKEFFRSEIERLRTEVDLADASLRREFDGYPGVDPTDLRGVGGQLEALRLQRDNAYQHKAEIEAQVAVREQYLVAWPDDVEVPNDPNGVPFSMCPGAATPTEAAIDRSIEDVKAQIVERITGRGMTMEHPEIVRLRSRLDGLEELRNTIVAAAEALPPPTTAPAEGPVVNEQTRKWRGEQLRVGLEAESLRRQLEVASRQWGELNTRTERLSALYDRLIENDDGIRKLKEKKNSGATEIGLWSSYLTNLDRVLTVESGERGTQFSLIEEPEEIGAPTKPRLSAVLMVCPGLGLAAAAICVAFSELFDRSFRSVGQVTRALGVPVLECIGVIPTHRERRRRLIRQLLWTPALAVLVFLLVTSAGLAYTSLVRPDMHRRMVQQVDQLLGATSITLAPLAPPSDDGP